MAKIYANRIIAGKITIEEVPQRWREEVESILAARQNELD